MAGKKGENTKKAAGNAKKAEIAAQKAATEDARQEATEADKWQKGAKSNAKRSVDLPARLAKKLSCFPIYRFQMGVFLFSALSEEFLPFAFSSIHADC